MGTAARIAGVTARTSELVSKLSLTDQSQLTDVVRRLLDEAG